MQGSQNGRFINLHNSLKLQYSQKTQKIQNSKKINKVIFFKLNKIVASLAVLAWLPILCGPV